MGRRVLGLAFVAAGVLPILAAFDIGPLRREDINGPPWLAIAAGGIFVLAGIAGMIGGERRDHPVSYLIVGVIVAAFAAIADWIAFGPGTRQCSFGFSTWFFASRGAAADFECRAAFGLGALIMNGLLVYMLAGAARRFAGPGPVTDRLDKFGGNVLLLSLLPILLPLLVFGIGTSFVAALRERLKTGQWPRNEAFIARLKKRRQGDGS